MHSIWQHRVRRHGVRRHGVRHRTSLGTAALLALGVLAGCGGDPAPAPPPPSSETPATSTPSPTPTELPSSANQKSDAGVEAFSRFFFTALNSAARSGTTEGFRPLFVPACVSCEKLAQRIDALTAAGGSINSEGWTVKSIKVLPEQPVSRKYVELLIHQSPQIVIDATNATPKSFPGGEQPMFLLVAWTDSGWRVTDLRRAA